MGLTYENLDEETRRLMLEELDADLDRGAVYMSQRLVPGREQAWLALLRAALIGEHDDWLAAQLERQALLEQTELRRTPSGDVTVAQVPADAEQLLAEGEFNRYYARALCRRVQAEPGHVLEIYRAKAVARPRPESEARLRHEVSADVLLTDLRTGTRVDAALGVPMGPNSGLSVRMKRRTLPVEPANTHLAQETAPNPPGTEGRLPPPAPQWLGGG
jgi:hypothetical protein